ncbi:sugar ABC transporter substrate-binding protein [Salipaludibacillus neizhouensis]|uniref:Sugar ABC transporter substrate-binding protein n=1 Tax=Salipaludibacillus neizhouensis TaxID=885475 RepID=A0A3A9K3B5_9BACI|nr:extracellular solute-binding protein [Salipaludibacillus neizhouensis]RKL67167.1 sugar ABC transporter substrate-binding protein [Salipaludibacillus neizhouensis]
MKKILMLLCTAFMIFLITACGGDAEESASGNEEGSSSGNSDTSEEQVELRMSWWGSQGRHDMTKEVITLYEKQNPHVKITTEFTGFDGYFEKMAAQAAGSNLPDIMQQNFGEFVNQYAAQNLLTDLAPFVEDGTIDLEGTDEGTIDSGKVEGKLVGIPTGTNAMATIYNPKIFEEAGVEPPTHDWTWEDYQTMAQEIHDATGKYGTRLLEPGNHFEYYLREQGEKLFNEDGTGLGYEGDQLLVDYFTRNKEMIDSDLMPSYDIISQIKGLEDELITRGEAATDLTSWSNQIGSLQDAAGTPLEMVMLPGENNDRGMYLKPSMLWSISENSEHKEEAAKFISFFTNATEVFEIIGTDRGVPIDSDVREELAPILSEGDQQVYEYIEYVGKNSTPADTNFPSDAAEVLQTLVNIDELVMYGELTPEEGSEQFRKDAENILAK